MATTPLKLAAVEAKLQELVKDAGPLQPVVSYVASTRGKRLRPLLVMWSAEACRHPSSPPPDKDTVLDVSVAFELSHMASLLHDDIIDNASQRRGLPAAHIVWGVHSAILAGDYLFTRANRVALRYAGLGVASLLNQAIELMCEGEVAQDERSFDATVTERDYMSHICGKTGALIGAACQAGALIAGAGGGTEEELLRYGIELGCAFQIADDVMDLSSDPRTSGKPVCNDLRRGILTLPLILALGSPAGVVLERALRCRTVQEDVVDHVREACQRWGCLERAREIARTLARSAELRLDLLEPSEARCALASVARGIVDRER
jgi:heptaprenyl diphosphate synthase